MIIDRDRQYLSTHRQTGITNPFAQRAMAAILRIGPQLKLLTSIRIEANGFEQQTVLQVERPLIQDSSLESRGVVVDRQQPGDRLLNRLARLRLASVHKLACCSIHAPSPSFRHDASGSHHMSQERKNTMNHEGGKPRMFPKNLSEVGIPFGAVQPGRLRDVAEERLEATDFLRGHTRCTR